MNEFSASHEGLYKIKVSGDVLTAVNLTSGLSASNFCVDSKGIIGFSLEGGSSVLKYPGIEEVVPWTDDIQFKYGCFCKNIQMSNGHVVQFDYLDTDGSFRNHVWTRDDAVKDIENTYRNVTVSKISGKEPIWSVIEDNRLKILKLHEDLSVEKLSTSCELWGDSLSYGTIKNLDGKVVRDCKSFCDDLHLVCKYGKIYWKGNAQINYVDIATGVENALTINGAISITDLYCENGTVIFEGINTVLQTFTAELLEDHSFKVDYHVRDYVVIEILPLN